MAIRKTQTLFSKLYSKSKELNIPNSESSQDSKKIKILILVFTVLISSFFFTYHIKDDSDSLQISPTRVGDKWSSQTVIAPFSFPIYKDKAAYEDDLQSAKEKILLVFLKNSLAKEKTFAYLDTLLNQITMTGEFSSEIIKRKFSGNNIQYLLQSPAEDRNNRIRNIIQSLKRLLEKSYESYLIDSSLNKVVHNAISVYIPPNEELIVSKTLLVDKDKFIENAGFQLSKIFDKNDTEVAIEILKNNYIPNIEYSESFSNEAVELAQANVARTNGFVKRGQIIVSKGEFITKEINQRIESFNLFAYNKQSGQLTIQMIIGNFIHASLILSILIVYLIIIRKRIFADNNQVGILCLVVIITGAFAWITMQVQTSLPIELFILMPGLSMLVAIVFDSRTAFYTTVTMALMLAGIRGNDYDTGTTMLIAGMLAAYSVRDIQGRTQLFRSMLMIFIGLALVIVSFSLSRSLDFMSIGTRLFTAGLNAAISPLLTFGLLFLIEKTTSITTDLKLEEYNDVNHPLLVKLSELAPGSYQHTLTMAIMAEKCARAINANPLLAKVGAYFHDIGKILRPEYFAENQIDIENKHESLSPKKSAEAIKMHVTDGIKLAKEFKLPERIVDFIPMHHGTTLIKHFYAKAIEMAGDENVNEADFRYPGPKPRNKETAIVMICDSSEAISRLSGKSKEEIEKIIENTIQSRFLDGQFDESNVTLNDLKTIKDTCVRHLYGATHQRVEYKEIPKSEV